jgi:hypothetical protein
LKKIVHVRFERVELRAKVRVLRSKDPIFREEFLRQALHVCKDSFQALANFDFVVPFPDVQRLPALHVLPKLVLGVGDDAVRVDLQLSALSRSSSHVKHTVRIFSATLPSFYPD